MADGTLIEVTKEEYLSQNPALTEEQFYELKALSDEMFKDDMNEERTQQRTKEKEAKNLLNVVELPTIDDTIIVEEEKTKIHEVAVQLLESKTLTPVQERRFVKHYVEGLSYRQIAEEEGVDYTSVRDSIKWAKKKLKKFFEQ